MSTQAVSDDGGNAHEQSCVHYFANIDNAENAQLQGILEERIHYFRSILETNPVESVDVYEQCILECIRLGRDKDAYECAETLADYIKQSSRYKKLAIAWRLGCRADMCTVLLTRHLDDFFCDFPISHTLFDLNRQIRFRYTMWDQGQVFVFGDNKNRLLGVKDKFIPSDKPVELKLPTTLAAMGSSQFHTVFQGINGEFFGCGAARNFSVQPKSETEIIEEPTKIMIKFEPTDPVKNFYVSDHGTLIWTDKYIYLIGKCVDPKQKNRKWTSAFPEKWFAKVGKPNQQAKNLWRFTIEVDKAYLEKHHHPPPPISYKSMPFNGSYLTKDNYAWVDFKGKPIKVLLNEKNAYYMFEGEEKHKRIVNFVTAGLETKMGVGPDAVYPNGKIFTLEPGHSLYSGQLCWAKKANCTDENDVTQYTLLAYMDECHGKFFMERFVATPDGRGYLYQVGRAENRPFYTLKPTVREANRYKMYNSYWDYTPHILVKTPDNIEWDDFTTIIEKIESKVDSHWFDESVQQITHDYRHLHMIGFIAFALTPRTRLIRCHARCSSPCSLHSLPSDRSVSHLEPFADRLSVPRLFDRDSDLFTADGTEYMSERLRSLMNAYDDNVHRFEPLYHSRETRTIMESARIFNECELNYIREHPEKGLRTTELTPLVIAKTIRSHFYYIRRQVKWLSNNEKYFQHLELYAVKRTLYLLLCVCAKWCIEYSVRGTVGWWLPRTQNCVSTQFMTRNPQPLVLRKIQEGLLIVGDVPMDLNVRFQYRIKKDENGQTEDNHAMLNIHTNSVFLSMLNPTLLQFVQHNVLSLNSMLDGFDSLWAVTLEYPLCVFFFLQHYRQSPVTVNESTIPSNGLAKYGFRLELEKHAADCPDRMFGVTWHYATLKINNPRKDTDVIAPIDLFGEDDIWVIECRGGKNLKVHRYLPMVYSRAPMFSFCPNIDKKSFKMDEEYDLVLSAFRMIPDINLIEKHSWEKRLDICRFYNKYKFPEALFDALAAITLIMTEADSHHIRSLITDYPIIMERHIGVLRPTIVLNWKDDFLPEPKIIHMARITEYWPEKQVIEDRITKSQFDPSFCRLLRTDEQWKRQFFMDPEKDNEEMMQSMYNEDMFTKTTYDSKDKPLFNETY
ncbi:unnamed protein product [Caenorhabditis sp. 36 PRJEB53466]|nr:unnamed protein product [Caenorhabditis sp. 36 PRJEB53466]